MAYMILLILAENFMWFSIFAVVWMYFYDIGTSVYQEFGKVEEKIRYLKIGLNQHNFQTRSFFNHAFLADQVCFSN